MKITMLGISRSGKTSYYGTLLNSLYKKSINNFQIKGRDNKEEDEISKLQKKIGYPLIAKNHPKFPPGTANMSSFTFPLYKDNRLLLTFDFIDYAGGDLEGIDCGELVKEKLTTAIELSDVTIILVDAILLSIYQNDMQMAREQLGVNTIISVLTKAKQELINSGKKINVIFMLTKTDAVEVIDNLFDLKDRVLQLYQELFINSIVNMYSIYDVSAVGVGNIKTTILKEETGGFQILNEITKLSCGKNIASVLAKAILYAIDNITYDIKDITYLLDKKKRELNFFMKIIDFLSGGRRHRYIHELESKLEDNRAELRNLSASDKIIDELKALANSGQ